MNKIRGVNVFLLFFVITMAVAFILLSRTPADTKGVKYLIGMSQCNMGEPWRIQMDNDIMSAAEKYPDIKIIFTDAAQHNQKQIEDVKKLMQLGIDLLIISPNESEPLTPIISEVFKKIPVIVLDRKTSNDDYTLFIGADNRVIGESAGDFVKNILGTAGGNIVEIMGLPGSTPTIDRSEGFRKSVSANANIQIVGAITADWLRDAAEDRFKDFLADNTGLRIDVVYAHNDPMALGAYKAATSMGRASEMMFVGIDGLAGEEGGINMVKEGIIDITFVYPTGGEEAIEYAMRILKGEIIEEKQVVLDNIQIDTSNYHLYLNSE